MVKPGAYRCVCLEVELNHLAVAAIAALEDLAEAEGGDANAADFVSGPPALPVLGKLVAAWLRDASERSNMCVRLSCSHFVQLTMVAACLSRIRRNKTAEGMHCNPAALLVSSCAVRSFNYHSIGPHQSVFNMFLAVLNEQQHRLM